MHTFSHASHRLLCIISSLNNCLLKSIQLSSAIICSTPELVRSMGLFLIWCHRLICIILFLCKYACKWWPDFVTFIASKKSRVGLKSDKKAQYVSNRCKDLFKRKKYSEVRCTLKAKLTEIKFIYHASIEFKFKISGRKKFSLLFWWLKMISQA